MEQIRIKQIVENDIDGVIRSAGGTRFESDDSADYQINEAIIELKFIAEEGLKNRHGNGSWLICSRRSNVESL